MRCCLLAQVEFAMDEVAKEIQRNVRHGSANGLSNPSSLRGSSQDVTMRGKLPSYMSLNLYDGARHNKDATGHVRTPQAHAPLPFLMPSRFLCAPRLKYRFHSDWEDKASPTDTSNANQ
eukprot:6087772-Pleurochrysis_carterae.AAC.1